MPSEMIPPSSNFSLDRFTLNRTQLENQSRRVIISNLPSGVSIAQILRGVRGFGPVVNVHLIDTAEVKGQGTKSASIEFMSSYSAESFVWSAKSEYYLEFEDNNTRRVADVWRVPGRTQEAESTSDRGKVSRRFKMDNFPVNAVWFFICTMGGEKTIVHASYDYHHGKSLTVEFVSLAHSIRAYKLVGKKEFPFYVPCFGSLSYVSEDQSRLDTPIWNGYRTPSESLRSVEFYFPSNEELSSISEGTVSRTWCSTPDYSLKCQFVAWIAPDEITTSFDKVPYNEDWPDSYHDIMSKYHLEPRSKEEMEEARKRAVKKMAKYLGFHRRGWSWQATCGKVLSRRTSLSSLSMSRDSIISTMSIPRLENTWTSFFRDNQDATIDVQRWEHYSRLAQHRRELCAQQGLLEGQIPECHDGCEFGCVAIKAAPVSLVIREFLEQEWHVKRFE
ncbi:unnamed protein product [Clonostachys rosea]|uniref:RRM domain-containing protein n=1 Tax=Bionectria ochroleuca TaxID=29856 RepID=A0ABY6UPB2_BIOOC|nr:unnamed protein product [Clonostachys rosea]